jgi:hypothetical protein
VKLDLKEGDTMQQLSLEHISPKRLNELERNVQDLLATMRKAKLRDEHLRESLVLLGQKLGEARRARFDATNPEYRGY